MKIKGIRWWMVSLVAAGLIINYLARNTLSVAAPRKAWLWQNGPERTLLTYALLLRRVQVGAQG